MVEGGGARRKRRCDDDRAFETASSCERPSGRADGTARTGPLARGAFLAAGGAALNWAPAGIASPQGPCKDDGAHPAYATARRPQECLCEFWMKMGMPALIRSRDWPRSHQCICASPRGNAGEGVGYFVTRFSRAIPPFRAECRASQVRAATLGGTFDSVG
ncbi:hypothetical protein MRX96_016846 [Rhipicephalus microplus]